MFHRMMDIKQAGKYHLQTRGEVNFILSLSLALVSLPLNNGKIIPVFRNLLTEKFSKNCWYKWNKNLQSGGQLNLNVCNPMQH